MKMPKEDISTFFDYGIYPATNTLYVGSCSANEHNGEGTETGTDYLMADRAVKGLHILDAYAQTDITVLLNNLGGDEYHGMAIYDAIQACSNRVKVQGIGYVMSMGSLILQAADWRQMYPNARLMIHYGTWTASDHSKIVKQWAKECENFETLMEDIYLDKIREKHPKFTRQRLQKMLNFDTILTAQETVDLGLADEVIGD